MPRKEAMDQGRAKRPLVPQMAAHVAQLATQHGIRTVPGTRGRAWKRTRTVRIPPVKTGITYALALHELGHLLGRQPRTRLEREAAAWEWARGAALTWTDAMEGKMRRCLESYRRWATRRRGVVKECAALDALLVGSEA